MEFARTIQILRLLHSVVEFAYSLFSFSSFLNKFNSNKFHFIINLIISLDHYVKNLLEFQLNSPFHVPNFYFLITYF